MQDFPCGTVVWRPLISRALSEDIAQTQENKDCQRQENDGVNVHDVFTF